MSITTMRNHSWNPHPLLKERGSTFQKLVGGQNFLLEREDKPEKGVDVEMGRGGLGAGEVATVFTTLRFSSVTFAVCGGKVRYPFITFWIF